MINEEKEKSFSTPNTRSNNEDDDRIEIFYNPKKHKTQLETRQLTENEARQYIVSRWISEDFLASDLKPSKILQPTTFLNPQLTFLEKFLEKRRQRQVVRQLLNQGLLPSNAIKTGTYILDFAVLSNHHLEVLSNVIQENLYEDDARKKSLPPQSIQTIPTFSEVPQEFMSLLESEIFILDGPADQVGRIHIKDLNNVKPEYTSDSSGKKQLWTEFALWAYSNNIPYTTSNTTSSHHKAHLKCVKGLIQGLQPLSNSINNYLENTYPALYNKLKKLDLGPNVSKSFGAFPTVTINFNVICQFHRDMKDHRNTLCVVCPLGEFKGGELAFPELKLVVHMKQGRAVAFRSNLLIHGNLPVIAGVRHSVVFYIHNTAIKQKRKFGSLFADYDLGWDSNSNEDESSPKLGSGNN
ncbi:4985_t:CDS:2, partial [Acaulospora colombiana]